ncbi:MAG: hypothetical protein K9K64_12250 [Desulfohalobiaceae bacterium]|nr:hypothetical protein [Desulfohalobiaceae bacterium]
MQTLLLSLFILLLSVAGGPGQAAASERSDGALERRVLRLGLQVGKVGSLDPHLASGSQGRIIADMLFNGLLRYKPGLAPKLEPDLARNFPEYKMVKGKQVWTVTLKKGVFFHPVDTLKSYELTADDVVFSLRKAADPRYSKYAGAYSNMSFREIDEHTLQIILDKPLSPTLFFSKIADYSGGFIVSKRAIEARGYDWFQRHPVGTGPFRFVRRLPEEKVVLAGHDRYFRGRPKLEGVEVHLMPSFLRREAAVKAGRLDAAVATGDPGFLERLVSGSRSILDIHGVGEVVTIYLNTSKAPLGDITVRKAILHALDRKEFLKSCHPVVVEEVLAPVPGELLPGGMNKQMVRVLNLDYESGPEKAGSLLAAAGYADGFRLKVIASEKRLYRRLHAILKEQLARIDVRCDLEFVPHSEMHRRIRNNESDMVIYGAWRPSTDAYLTRFFHSESMVLTGKNPDTNFSCYDRIDPLIEAARTEILPGKQKWLWAHAQIRILNDAVAYPLFFVKQFFFRRPSLDYGHPLSASMALYPQVTEKTCFIE